MAEIGGKDAKRRGKVKMFSIYFHLDVNLSHFQTTS